jgi:tRNA (guanine37-N1)-methyltransferase
MTFHVDIITLFPALFPGPLDASLAGAARRRGVWALSVHDLRQFGIGRHRAVDDTPAGGGPGMVLRADVVAAALDTCLDASEIGRPRLMMSPRGAPLTQQRVRQLAQGPGLAILCGRFEGIDERVIAGRNLEEVSIGDYILSGGEIAAFAVVDACVRVLPGVMGGAASMVEESFETGLLEYPHYTRPRRFEGQEIPEVLLCGDHAKVAAWRREQALKITQKRRPDLMMRAKHSPTDDTF